MTVPEPEDAVDWTPSGASGSDWQPGAAQAEIWTGSTWILDAGYWNDLLPWRDDAKWRDDAEETWIVAA